jgi:hypothetical protein
VAPRLGLHLGHVIRLPKKNNPSLIKKGYFKSKNCEVFIFGFHCVAKNLKR